MRRIRLGALVIGLWLLLAIPVAAQSGSVRIQDGAGVLGAGQGQVQAAAQSLANEGAEVLIVTSDAATQAAADPEIDALQAAITPNQIIFFVAPTARYTAIYYGSRWIDTLEPVQQRIQEQVMNPLFASGDIVGGFVAGIDAVRTTINPPTSPLVYAVGVAAVAAVAAVVIMPVLRRRRQTAGDLATARERMEDARQAAGATIADLGQLIETSQEKAAYDRVSYGQDDVVRLAELQNRGMQQFEAAQAAYDAAGEQEIATASPTAQEYDVIAAQYAEAQTLAAEAGAFIREAEALRRSLDARGAPSTGPTTRLDQ